MTLKNKQRQIIKAISRSRKLLLNCLELSLEPEKFQRLRGHILNVLGHRGLDGEIIKIFNDSNNKVEQHG